MEILYHLERPTATKGWTWEVYDAVSSGPIEFGENKDLRTAIRDAERRREYWERRFEQEDLQTTKRGNK